MGDIIYEQFHTWFHLALSSSSQDSMNISEQWVDPGMMDCCTTSPLSSPPPPTIIETQESRNTPSLSPRSAELSISGLKYTQIILITAGFDKSKLLSNPCFSIKGGKSFQQMISLLAGACKRKSNNDWLYGVMLSREFENNNTTLKIANNANIISLFGRSHRVELTSKSMLQNAVFFVWFSHGKQN